VKWPPRV